MLERLGPEMRKRPVSRTSGAPGWGLLQDERGVVRLVRVDVVRHWVAGVVDEFTAVGLVRTDP